MISHPEIWAVAGLLLVLGVLEAAAGRLTARTRHDELWVDVVSLGQFAFLIKPFIVAATAFAVAALPAGLGVSLPGWSFGLRLLAFVLVADFLHYAYHRLGHRVPVLWRMHRTHHTATAMSVSIAYRENWRWYLFMPDLWLAGVLIASGWADVVLAGQMIFGLANVLTHSAFAWDAPLYRFPAVAFLIERVVQLPSTHRAHHAMRADDGKAPLYNYAQLLMIWDVLLGTARLPRGRDTGRIGIQDDPGDPWYAQLWYPLLKSPQPGSEYH